MPEPRPRPERPVVSPRHEGQSGGARFQQAPIDAIEAPAAAVASATGAFAHACSADAPGVAEGADVAEQSAQAAGPASEKHRAPGCEARDAVGASIARGSSAGAFVEATESRAADLMVKRGDNSQALASLGAAPAIEVDVSTQQPVGACSHAPAPADGGVCMAGAAACGTGAPAATLGDALNTCNIGIATCPPGGGEMHGVPPCHAHVGTITTPVADDGGSMAPCRARNGDSSAALVVEEAVRHPYDSVSDCTLDHPSTLHARGRLVAVPLASGIKLSAGASVDETRASLALRAGWAAFSHQSDVHESLQAQCEARRSGRELLLAWLVWRRLARDSRLLGLPEGIGRLAPPSKRMG